MVYVCTRWILNWAKSPKKTTTYWKIVIINNSARSPQTHTHTAHTPLSPTPSQKSETAMISRDHFNMINVKEICKSAQYVWHMIIHFCNAGLCSLMKMRTRKKWEFITQSECQNNNSQIMWGEYSYLSYALCVQVLFFFSTTSFVLVLFVFEQQKHSISMQMTDEY